MLTFHFHSIPFRNLWIQTSGAEYSLNHRTALADPSPQPSPEPPPKQVKFKMSDLKINADGFIILCNLNGSKLLIQISEQNRESDFDLKLMVY